MVPSRIDRRLRACTAVVFVFSCTFSPFGVDLTRSTAGFPGGRVGAVGSKGVVGGVVAVCYLLVGSLLGAIGGWTAPPA
ncbi:hypothetical protein [Halopiger djelfimassiliensis]|uniref:hypothetical protein n=1 Tax=Halopiger djelfimassiliensis TaxID=1293047 RepID=UPI0006780A7C|nr:hypothetical protein [Halopiger djelfimassiliensis]